MGRAGPTNHPALAKAWPVAKSIPTANTEAIANPRSIPRWTTVQAVAPPNRRAKSSVTREAQAGMVRKSPVKRLSTKVAWASTPGSPGP